MAHCGRMLRRTLPATDGGGRSPREALRVRGNQHRAVSTLYRLPAC
jgi:hypothetical protein